MKKYFYFSILILILSAFIPTFAQDNQQDMMKAWQDYMTPGPMHQILAKNVGEWKLEMTVWMAPDQPPAKSEGTSICEPILDGKYFQNKQNGSFNNMPFSGIEISGYDNARKVFFSTWIDNMGTGIMLLEGKYDEAAKTLTYTGTSTDPMGNQIKVRETFKFIDDNNKYYEMFVEQNGKEFKTMEVKYTKKI